MTVVAVTDATFEAEVLRSEIPVFVNLCAEGRPPCAQMVPILDELATLVLVKHFGFEAMPTVVAPEVNPLSHMRCPRCL